MKPRAWYRVENKAEDSSTVDIHIVDFIGDWLDDQINRFWGDVGGVTARAFVEDLAKLPEAVKTIRVHINSPGGDIQGAVNIANALRDQARTKGRTVETQVDGIAASAASIVLMAGSVVRMADNALVMIHNPWTVAIGTSDDMLKTAEVLDTMRGQIIATYQWHSPLDEKSLAKLMDDETWMNAEEALAAGFVTEVTEGLAAAASLDPRGVKAMRVPEQYRARVDALLKKPDPAPAPAEAVAVMRICREAGCSDLAEPLVEQRATIDTVQARVGVEKERRAKEQTRVTDITALCGIAKQPAMAADFITGGMTVAAVRAVLPKITALAAGREIDNTLPPDQGVTPKPKIDSAAIYAARNAKKE